MTRQELTKRIFDNAGYIENMIVASLITGTCASFTLSYLTNGGHFSWLWFILYLAFMPSTVFIFLLLFNWCMDRLFRPLHKGQPIEKWGTFYTLCLLTTPVGGLIYLLWGKLDNVASLMGPAYSRSASDDYDWEDDELYDKLEDEDSLNMET